MHDLESKNPESKINRPWIGQLACVISELCIEQACIRTHSPSKLCHYHLPPNHSYLACTVLELGPIPLHKHSTHTSKTMHDLIENHRDKTVDS